MGGEHRRDIDGLRAVAVLAVVAFHVGIPETTGGFVGVDVFFVISGFLITGLIAREVARTASVALAEFYARRVRRLLPALATVVAATLVLAALVLMPLGSQQALARSAFATAVFASNLYFWNASGDYFAEQSGAQPLLHTWSLGVEEQYYLVWPLLLLIVAIACRRRGWGFARLAAPVLAALFVGSLIASLFATARAPFTAFYLTPFRAWEFASGGLLALLAPVRLPLAVAEALGALGLAAILASVVTFTAATAFPGWAALLPVLGATALIAAGSGAEQPRVSRWLGLPPLFALGQLSYSWYLWHWPLLVLVRAHALGERALARDALVAVVALGLAALTYRYVENTVRYGRPGPFASTRGTLVVGLALSAGVAALGLGAGVQAARLEKSAQAAGLADDAPEEVGGCQGGDCLKRPWGASPGLVVWGDSHAARLLPLAVAFAAERGVGVLQRTSPGCPPLSEVIPTRQDGLPNVACGAFNDAVQRELQELARAGRARAVLLVGRWPNYLDPPPGEGGLPRRLCENGQVLDREGSIRALAQGLRARVAELRAAGVRVLVVAPLPEFPWSVPACAAQRGGKQCVLDRPAAEAQRAAALEAVRAALDVSPEVRLFDGFDAFCDARKCDSARGGRVLFADEHHLSRRGAELLLPLARPDLTWLLGGERPPG
jgi:peptidoglycan/LPS O-acetylase OafA/YrhL